MNEQNKFDELQHQSNLEYYKAQCAAKLELSRTVNLAGQSALRACVFLNAGSAIAILAFIANVWDKTDKIESDIGLKIVVAVSLFGFGALIGSIATGFTYLSQYALEVDKDTLGYKLNVYSNGLVFLSYNLFVIGGYLVLAAIGKKFGLSFISPKLVNCLLLIILILVNLGFGVLAYKVLKIEKTQEQSDEKQ